MTKQIQNSNPNLHRCGALFIVVVAVLFIVGCQNSDQPTGAVPTQEEGSTPEREFFGYRRVNTEAGVRQWVLESDEMQQFAGQEDILLIKMKMDFFKEGEYFSTLTSDSGRVNRHTKNVFAWDSVVVVTEDGRRLDTEELYFNNQTQLIHNDVFDRYTSGEDVVVTGIGLEATPDLEYIEIKHEVEAEIGDDANLESGSQ